MIQITKKDKRYFDGIIWFEEDEESYKVCEFTVWSDYVEFKNDEKELNIDTEDLIELTEMSKEIAERFKTKEK